MGVLQLPKLVELLNTGDLQRCGCAEVDLQQFFANPDVLMRSKVTPGKCASSHIRVSTSPENEPYFSDLIDDVDDQSESSDDMWESHRPSLQLDSMLWLGPEVPPEKSGREDVQESLPDWHHDVQSIQSISWELPPSALAAPISPEVGSSLRSTSSLYKNSVASTAGKPSALPFSALLCLALDQLSKEIISKRGTEASETGVLGRKRLQSISPPALDVPQTKLAPKLPFTGKENKEPRQLSAAELWLGEEPSD